MTPALYLSSRVEAVNQVVMDVKRGLDVGRVELDHHSLRQVVFSRRKNILCCALLVMEVMFSSHSWCCEMIVLLELDRLHSNWSHTGLFPKSTTISAVFRILSFHPLLAPSSSHN